MLGMEQFHMEALAAYPIEQLRLGGIEIVAGHAEARRITGRKQDGFHRQDFLRRQAFHHQQPRPVAREVDTAQGVQFTAFDIEAEHVDVPDAVFVQEATQGAQGNGAGLKTGEIRRVVFPEVLLHLRLQGREAAAPVGVKGNLGLVTIANRAMHHRTAGTIGPEQVHVVGMGLDAQPVPAQFLQCQGVGEAPTVNAADLDEATLGLALEYPTKEEILPVLTVEAQSASPLDGPAGPVCRPTGCKLSATRERSSDFQ